jgi:hypothetical protein
MGLDAHVCCDCFEKGRLRESPPAGISLHVEPDGSLARQHDDSSLEADLAWDQWRYYRACEHTRGVLLHHRLGNIALIALLEDELARESGRFPILLKQVLYSGTHAGDFLSVEAIPSLQDELRTLAAFKCSTPEADVFLAEFRAQMSELADTAMSVDKPIAF